VGRAFSYWRKHWDWEMPTLTGLSLQEFEAAAESWCANPSTVSATVLVAALSAVRECWAQVPNATELLDLPGIEVRELLNVLAKELDDAV
jgi:hypothetical protein